MSYDRCAAAALMLAGALAAQGDSGFLSGAGRTHIALSVGFDRASEVKLDTGRVALAGDLDRTTAQLFAAHGLTESLDVVGAVAYVATDPAAGLALSAEDGLQDGYAGIRWRFARSRFAAGTWSAVLVPGVETPLSDYATDSIAAIGDGETTLSLNAVTQFQWNDGPFLAAEAGFRDDLGDASDQLFVGASGGLTVFEAATVSAFWYHAIGFGGETLTTIGGPGAGGGGGPGGGGGQQTRFSIASVDFDYQTIGLSLFVRLREGLGLTTGYYRAIGGDNTVDGEGAFVGMVLSFG